MSKLCSICGKEVGFFSGKFIEENYVCKACYELHLKELSICNNEEEQNSHTWIKYSEAYAKPYKYKKWTLNQQHKTNK